MIVSLGVSLNCRLVVSPTHMNPQAELGPPDLKIAGFQLWVHGWAHPDDSNVWDRNWLSVTAHCGSHGASIRVQGSLLMVSDVADFGDQCAAMHRNNSGSAVLDPFEPELKVLLETADLVGHIRARVEITPDHMTQSHRMEFDLDQSYLPDIIKQCSAILQEYPVRRIP